MPFDKITYPWFFFYRIARLVLLIFLPTLMLIVFFYRTSYKEGLYSQIYTQIQEDLRAVNHTITIYGKDWEGWCQGLPNLTNVQYVLSKRDGTILCNSLSNESEDDSVFFKDEAVSAELVLDNGLIIKKVVPVSSLKENLSRFDRILFLRILPLSFAAYILFVVFFYLSTKPLGIILSKVKKYKDDIPFNKNIRLLYQRDEWAAIVEALNEADEKLKIQAQEARAENDKSKVILESINDDILAVDKFETILFYNSKFKNDFLKENSDSQIHPKLWHTFEDELLLQSFRTVLTSGRPISLKRMNFPNSHRPERFFDITITPLTSSDGNVTGALGVFYDITEFKLSEQMRVDFVANVSHEIRTPLTSIKGYTQILQSQSDKIDQSLHVFLDKIIGNTERMISLFNDLLNLSVLESRNLHTLEDLDLPQIVETVAENIKTNYPEKEITISADLSLISVKGDDRLMEQVISNLMDNACKYSTSNTINIKVSSFIKNNKGLITISDNGPGISKEHLQRIFERFYRVDSSREVTRGTGLGLSIVKHIINKHRGRIWAESDGHGTTFLIELPLE